MRAIFDPIALYLKMKPRMEGKIEPYKLRVNLMPALDVDFAPLFEAIVPDDVPRPEKKKRSDMANHWVRIRAKYRGQAEILALNMLLIAYLRRNTPFTAHAWALFERLWNEHCEELLSIMRMRDLVSALRTFADHSPDPVRRLSAKLAFTYGHLIKIYETERVLEGLALEKASYVLPANVPMIGMNNTRGVRVGGDNSFEIPNLLLLEEVQNDVVIGPMILSLLSRVHSGDTVFSRYDRARIHAGYKLNSGREWAFGFRPGDENV